MRKKPLVVLEASEPFQVTDKETGIPVNDVIYRMVLETHRDGRKRRVLRGRDMSEIRKFETWKQRKNDRASKEDRAA